MVFAIAFILAVACCGTVTFAQSGAGAIQGTITDSTGAVIPNAAVHVVNQGTGQSFDSTANTAGFYSVPALFAGNYTVTFTSPGMAKYETSIALQAAQTAVISPILTPGAVQQQVTVTANTIQLATYDSGTISSQLDNNRINQLPMNGRNVLTLTGMTTPGLESGGTRANGNMQAAIEYVQDGAPLSDRNFGGPTIMPDPDSIQEVKVETVASNARFATPATAIVTTKSGTNQLHGTFFETARNNAIGIAKSRQNAPNFAAPHLVRNEFGASIGGPIFLPKLYDGKNKSFFFFAYERYSLRSEQDELVTVPTQAMRNGDFSGLINSAGQLQVLYDSNTTNPVTFQRQPFANNQIPMGRLSPLAKTLYSISPLPTSADNPMVSSNFRAPGINNSTVPNMTARFDHTFNSQNSAYLRFTSTQSTTLGLRNYPTNQADTIGGSGLPAGASNEGLTKVSVYSAGLGYMHVFSPSFFSETVLSNEWESGHYGAGGNPSLNYEAMLGLPNNFGSTGFPQIGSTSLFMNYAGTQFNYASSQILTNLDENLSKTIGRHQLFFGGRYRHERLGALPDRTPDALDFNGMGSANVNPASGKSYTALPNTGDANADLFLGAAYYYTIRLNPPYEHWRNQEFDSYFQDNFQVNSKLTISGGLRWEIHPTATEKNNVFNGFNFKDKAIVLGQPVSRFIAKGFTTQAIITNLQNLGVTFESPQQAGLPEHMVYSNNFVFSPRIGFAYAPFGSGRGTVIRSGFGRYAYPIPIRNFYSVGKLNAPFATAYTQSYTAANQSPDGQPNYLLRSPQTVVAGQNSSNIVNSNQTNSILPGGPGEVVLNPHYPPNFVTQFNFTVEQPLKLDSVLRMSYIWDHGSNLDQLNNHNNAMSSYVWQVTTGTLPPTGAYASVALNPYDNVTYGQLTTVDRTGWSNDNALQLNYQRLYKKGYAYQIYYVFSRAMRVGGNTFRDSNIYPYADYAPGAAPSSDFDKLNRFQNYQIDSATPKHRISWNGIVDLPFGHGKTFFGNAGRLVDELIGGYQIAFDGTVFSQYFQPSSSYWGGVNPQGTGSIGPLHVYKKKYKITDCSSGVCRPGYLWFNGFINPLQIHNPCGPNAYTGIPSNYAPYQTPINMDPGTVTCVNGAVKTSNSNYLTNNVPVKLANGSTVQTAYNPGPAGVNPFSHTFLSGPFNWTADLSLFKVFPITEKINLRVNVDAFNAFNVQGYTNPSPSTGIQTFLSSYNTPRQLQFTARLTF